MEKHVEVDNLGKYFANLNKTKMKNSLPAKNTHDRTEIQQQHKGEKFHTQQTTANTKVGVDILPIGKQPKCKRCNAVRVDCTAVAFCLTL
jgi:hypothetical protein